MLIEIRMAIPLDSRIPADELNRGMIKTNSADAKDEILISFTSPSVPGKCYKAGVALEYEQKGFVDTTNAFGKGEQPGYLCDIMGSNETVTKLSMPMSDWSVDSDTMMGSLISKKQSDDTVNRIAVKKAAMFSGCSFLGSLSEQHAVFAAYFGKTRSMYDGTASSKDREYYVDAATGEYLGYKQMNGQGCSK